MPSMDQTTEASPLIQGIDADRQEPDHSQANDPGWTRDAIQTAGLAAFFLLLFALADVFKYLATLQLLELGVCYEQYSTANPSVPENVDGDIPREVCNSPEVQQRLADLRGYLGALEALVSLFLTLPYGLLVNRFGERLVAGVNIIGYLLACAWILLVFFSKSAIPMWAAVLSPLFQVIGGGSPFLSSIIYSIAAKHIPDSSRSLCFSFFMAAQAVTEVVAINTAALFLENKLEYMPLVLTFPLCMLCLLTLLFMRPKKSVKTVRECESEAADLEGTLRPGSLLSGLHIVAEICRDFNILILLAIFPVTKLIDSVCAVVLQYMPRRFGLSFATASRFFSIQAFESFIVLAAIIPFFKHISQTRFHMAFTKVDMYIVQFGFLVMASGCVVMASSTTLTVFMIGLSAFTFGCGARPALQSVLTDMVDRDKIAVLYTLMAVGDGLASATGSLIINHTFAVAIGWGNTLWLGLPFFVGAACYFYAFTGARLIGHTALSIKRRTDLNSD